ncbi:hypothetical protein ACVWXL_000516 [Bradyrhizobium sp. GM22.5]
MAFTIASPPPITSCQAVSQANRAMTRWRSHAGYLQAGHPQQKGSRRGPAYAYNIKALRDREMLIAAQAEQSYERLVTQWKPRRPKTGARAPQLGKTK